MILKKLKVTMEIKEQKQMMARSRDKELNLYRCAVRRA